MARMQVSDLKKSPLEVMPENVERRRAAIRYGHRLDAAHGTDSWDPKVRLDVDKLTVEVLPVKFST